MENKENLEGKKIDNLEATSASETTEVPELNSSPVPTEEEVEDAGLNSPEPEPAPVEEPVVEEPAPVSDTPVVENNVDSVAEPEKIPGVDIHTYTQEDLNDIAGKTRIETREKTFRYIYDRYGVEDEAGLDELIGNAQRYDSLQEKYDSDRKGWEEQSSIRDKELADVKEQVALMQSGIDSGRYDDAKLILRGKGLEVSLDNINNELSTHPEWKSVKAEEPQIPAEPVSKISVLGNNKDDGATSPEESEQDYALKKLFKV